MNSETFNKLIDESAEAGIQRVMGADTNYNEMFNMVCDIVDVSPDEVSSTVRMLMELAYDYAVATGDTETATNYIRELESYKYLLGVYGGNR